MRQVVVCDMLPAGHLEYLSNAKKAILPGHSLWRLRLGSQKNRNRRLCESLKKKHEHTFPRALSSTDVSERDNHEHTTAVD